MPTNRLIKKTGLYFVGSMSSKIMSVIIVPIYAFYIETADLGYYDFTTTIMGIATPFAFMAIWEAILSFLLHESNCERKNAIISTSSLFTLSVAAVLIMGFIVYGFCVKDSIKLLPLIEIMFLVSAVTHIWQYYARALDQSKLYIYAGILGSSIYFSSVLIFIVLMKMELTGLYLAYILGQFSILVLIELKLHIIRSIRFEYFDKNILKSMIKFAAPLILNLTSAWLISGFGRTLITLKLGVEANGMYTFAGKFSLIIAMLGSVVTMAIIEEAIIANKTKGIDSEFIKNIEALFRIFMSMALILTPSIIVFYSYIQSTDYYVSYKYAAWFLLYAVFTTMASNIGSVFYAINQTKYQFTTTILAAIVTVSVSIGLISLIGIYAVILGQVSGSFALLSSRYIMINRFMSFKVDWKPIFAMITLFVCITIISVNSNIIINLLLLGILSVVTCVINRQILSGLFNIIKGKLKKNKC